MLFAAVGEQVWLSLIAAVVTIAGGIVSVSSLYLAYLGRKLELGQQAAAEEVKQVKETLKETKEETKAQLDDIKATGDKAAAIGEKTHTLVNSAMGAQLALHAKTARAKFDATHDAGDLLVAELADEMLAQHQRKQEMVDRHDDEQDKADVITRLP